MGRWAATTSTSRPPTSAPTRGSAPGIWCWTWWCCPDAIGTTRTRTSSRAPSAPATSRPRRSRPSARPGCAPNSASPTGPTPSPRATSTSSRIPSGRSPPCPGTTPGIWISPDGDAGPSGDRATGHEVGEDLVEDVRPAQRRGIGGLRDLDQLHERNRSGHHLHEAARRGPVDVADLAGRREGAGVERRGVVHQAVDEPRLESTQRAQVLDGPAEVVGGRGPPAGLLTQDGRERPGGQQ